MISTPFPSEGQSPSPAPLQVESLARLDALVGAHVMGCAPLIYWEDSYTQWRFESLAEALEAMRDPFFSALTPEGSRSRSSLREVHEFPPYSSHLGSAMRVVEHLGTEEKPLVLWSSFGHWSATFAGGPGGEASTAPLAICLAALRGCGLHIEFEEYAEEVATERCLC